VIRIEWTTAARADLESIDAHLAAIDPDIATELGLAAIRAARTVAQWPRTGRHLGRGRRKRTIVGTPYILIYRLKGKRLQVLRVRHVRENWMIEI
jgi:plasmid stabilization system protein ParE